MPHLIDKEYAVVSIDSVEPYPGNARIGADKEIDRSLEIHGQYRPLVVQKSTGYILAGNNTFERLKAAGAETVKVTLEDVDDATARRINLADNNTADAADYDPQQLMAALEMAAAAESLDGTGFDEDDLATLRDEIARAEEDGPALTVLEGEDPYDVPTAGEDLTTKWGTALGQTWTLKPSEQNTGGAPAAPHLLHVGPLPAGSTFDNTAVGETGLPAYALWVEVPEALAGDELDLYLDNTLAAAEEALVGGAPFYVVHHPDRRSMPVVRSILAGGWHMQATILLTRDLANEHARDDEGRPYDYQDAYVPVAYGWKEGAPHRWYGGRDKDSVLPMGDSYMRVAPETVAALLYNSTRIGDPVLQLSASNASLLDACDRTGRRAILASDTPEAAATILEAADRAGLAPRRLEAADMPSGAAAQNGAADMQRNGALVPENPSLR